uniref:Uncharacterized protein n=1 Tax=Rhizophora mucronata TaxID=61149 RepID=A0A2P2IP25_RHIMU
MKQQVHLMLNQNVYFKKHWKG